MSGFVGVSVYVVLQYTKYHGLCAVDSVFITKCAAERCAREKQESSTIDAKYIVEEHVIEEDIK